MDHGLFAIDVFAGFHGIDRSFDAAECSHYNDWQSRVPALDGLQKLQPVHAGKLEIGQDEVDGIFA